MPAAVSPTPFLRFDLPRPGKVDTRLDKRLAMRVTLGPVSLTACQSVPQALGPKMKLNFNFTMSRI